MRRKIVPIVSTARKILGLSSGEWVLQVPITLFYLSFVPGVQGKAIAGLTHIAALVAYNLTTKKMEDGWLQILMANRKLPAIITGRLAAPHPIREHKQKSETGFEDDNAQTITYL